MAVHVILRGKLLQFLGPLLRLLLRRQLRPRDLRNDLPGLYQPAFDNGRCWLLVADLAQLLCRQSRLAEHAAAFHLARGYHAAGLDWRTLAGLAVCFRGNLWFGLCGHAVAVPGWVVKFD